MWAPATLKNGKPVLVDGLPYGFGWTVVGAPGHRVVGHSGWSGTFMLHLVDDRLTVIVLTNLDVASGGGHPYVLAAGIARLVRPAVVKFLKP